MSGAGIGRALDAAGEAVRRAMVKPPCCMEGTGCELPPCHCSRVAASAAVQGFLRAIPTAWVRDRYGADEAVFVGLLREMVEAAAQEGGG